jgi:D-tyrosyl-tRNA(Tyr) deacylase
MRLLIQRVLRAAVRLSDGSSRPIGPGLVVLIGVGKDDGEDAAAKLAEKTANLRIFSNGQGKFDLSLLDVKGSALVVSQFTLFGAKMQVELVNDGPVTIWIDSAQP